MHRIGALCVICLLGIAGCTASVTATDTTPTQSAGLTALVAAVDSPTEAPSTLLDSVAPTVSPLPVTPGTTASPTARPKPVVRPTPTHTARPKPGYIKLTVSRDAADNVWIGTVTPVGQTYQVASVEAPGPCGPSSQGSCTFESWDGGVAIWEVGPLTAPVTVTIEASHGVFYVATCVPDCLGTKVTF